MQRSRFYRVLSGTNQTVTAVVLVAGILGGASVWLLFPSLGEIAVSGTQYHYGLVPEQPLDWAFLCMFVLGSALTAYAEGGLLAAWWLVAPAVFALRFPILCPEGAAGAGTATAPGCDQLLNVPIILTALAIALIYAILGYLLGDVALRSLTTKAAQR